MGYVIFRGVGTEGSGSLVGNVNVLSDVYVSKMPSHRKAAMRFSEYYVVGRDGALHVNEGLSNYEMTIMLVLINAGADKKYLVNAWADGTGKLISSDDPTKCYKATVLEEVQWQRVKAHSIVAPFSSTTSYVSGDIVLYEGNVYRFTASHSGAWNSAHATIIAIPNGFFDTATIVFSCQPCMYETVDTVVEFTQSGTIVNPGSAEAYPLVKIEGSGSVTVTIAGSQIKLTGVTAGTPVYVDCENGYVYTEGGATTMKGDMPVLPIGLTPIDVTLGTNATRVTLTPHWRWV